MGSGQMRRVEQPENAFDEPDLLRIDLNQIADAGHDREPAIGEFVFLVEEYDPHGATATISVVGSKRIQKPAKRSLKL